MVTMSTQTITEFLEARIAEDEEMAKLAAFGWGDSWESIADHEDEWYTIRAEGKREVVGGEDSDVIGHIARHDPARVLAECAAKRAIIADHAEIVEAIDMLSAALPGDLNQDADALFRTSVYRRLAAVYADHHEFQQEWKL